MPSSNDIPLALQVLRVGAGARDETSVVRYTLGPQGTGPATPRFCVASDRHDTRLDLMQPLEDTLRLILDNGGAPDDVRRITGLARTPADGPVPDGWKPVGRGYGFAGDVTAATVLDEAQTLTSRQIENIRTAFTNLHPDVRLPAAMTLASREFSDWQAFEVCKSYEQGLGADACALIADPSLNHAQMRELRELARDGGSALLKSLARTGAPAEKMRAARSLMRCARQHGVPYASRWTDLDARQMRALRDAVASDVPESALRMYDDGTYSADLMAVITVALNDGMERPAIARLLHPDLRPTQAWGIYSAVSSGRYTAGQLDLLCDPTRAAGVMAAMRAGFAYGLGEGTVARFADAGFRPEQLQAVYRAAASDGVPAGALDLIADPMLDARRMTSLMVAAEQGASATDLAKQKSELLAADERRGAGRALGDAEKVSREAAGQLGTDGRPARDDARGELE